MSPVLIHVEADIATITLNRPEVANAFDLPMALAIAEVLKRCERDDVRVIVLTGAGPRFCGGGDVASFLASADPPGYVLELAQTAELAVRHLATVAKPVVAAVQGAVAGAGLALMLSCDLVVAGPRTKFATAFAEIGLSPDCGVSALLPRAIGLRRALEMTLRRKPIGIEQALEWNLVNEVHEDPLARAQELARMLADGPAVALGEARRLLRASYDVPRDQHANDEAHTISSLVATPEAAQLINAFTSRSAKTG